MFHAIDGLSVQEQQAANVREFVGDGTPFLKVPGLLDQPKQVRIGRDILPMTIVQEFPTDHTLKKLETVESPLYIMQRQADGTPVLLRSLQSNDGVWQAGARVFVQGDWEDDQAKDKKDAKDAKAAKLTRAGLTLEEAEKLDAEEAAKAAAEAKAKADAEEAAKGKK